MSLSKFRNQMLCGAAIAGVAGAVVISGVASTASPVLADAVRVEAPQAPSFADVVEAVSPAVVSVRVKANVQPTSDSFSRGFGFDNLPKDHPFRRFFEFGPRGDNNNPFRNRRGATSQGSGFFVSDDGYIVTNNHVVSGGSTFTVILNDGEEIDAKLIGTDPKTDLAVLKVDDDRDFTYVEFDSDKTRVGEWVVAVGNPFGLGGTVTAGIVSAANRDIDSGPYDDFLQIDAAVNKGNSGGPAFNLSGEVIGVNTAIFSPSGGNVGIAFAISAKSANEVVTDLIKNGSVTRGWLGVQIQPVTEDIAASLGLDEATGAIVSETQANSPALRAGLESGDVIVSVDDTKIDSPKTLARVIAGYAPQETANVTIIRDGEAQGIDVTLGKLPEDERQASLNVPSPTSGDTVDIEQFGLEISAGRDGVVVSNVTPGSEAAEKGVRSGDRIQSINGADIASINDVGSAIAEAMENERKAVLFQMKRGDRSRFVALPVERG
ncbi:MAG: Do family serine endopeptidase [Ahrensia sp.]|nr:Do family serine endopeptidase [Ahrensia sp.]